MIVKKHIVRTLNALDKRFTESLRSGLPEDSVYYAKLAILEYCGWIEESLDDVVRRSVKGKLSTMAFRQMLENSVIGNTYGFEYKKHFRPMLTRAIGLPRAEKIEKGLKRSGSLEILLNELNSMKTYRDNAAHTWTQGTTMTYPAPSIIRTSFEKVFPILKAIFSDVVAYRG